MKKLFARLFGRKPIPMPVTLSDCYLLHQMGYDIKINDGRISNIVKRNWFATLTDIDPKYLLEKLKEDIIHGKSK